MPFDFVTTFGTLPVGTTFECAERIRDWTDRRRKVTVRASFIKNAHGTIGGFACRMATNDSQSFDHNARVYVDASDLRLIVTIARSSWHRAS
jgi:hypothetical protein